MTTITSYKLKSGVKSNRKNPDTFWIPSAQEKAAVEPGDFVKLMFDSGHGVERMWVKVTANNGDSLTGTLANEPFFIPGLSFGEPVSFKPKHIIDIQISDEG